MPINGEESVGTCESCPNENVRIILCGTIWQCDTCRARDIAVALEHQTPEKQEARLANYHLEMIQKENASLRIQTDIFNAKMRGIHEVQDAINQDDKVVNKNYTIAQVIAERYKHLNGLIHDIDTQKTEYETEQRALQTFYNDLSKKLRAEEREKIKLQDLTYKPVEVPAKVKKIDKPKKWDKTGVAAASARYGIPEQLIQMTCAGRDITVDAAIMILKESMPSLFKEKV